MKFHPIVFPSRNNPFMKRIVNIMYGRGIIRYTANLDVFIPSKTVIKVRTLLTKMLKIIKKL